jgi:hypothetical protein
MKEVIMPSNLLHQALISCLQYEYDVLTDEEIQRVLYKLYCDYRIGPEYLFVSQKGRHELRLIMENEPSFYLFANTGRTVDDLVSQYCNKSTGTMMHVVVLPMLPENTLLFGMLALAMIEL